MKMRNVLITVFSVLFAVALAGQSGVEQRVLLPVPVDGRAGAYESLWEGELWAHNQGPTTAFIQTAWSLCGITCPPGRFVLEPGESVSMPLDRASMIVITPTPFVGATRVMWNARIFDVSRLSTDHGTEIPLVPESSFTAGPITLLNVPVAPGFRQTLRLYDATARQMQVRVAAWSQAASGLPAAGTLLAERTVTLVVHKELEGFPDTPFDVAYYEIGLFDLFPELATVDRARLEATPLHPESRMWAFVSVTHNETQRVTLITPQPSGLRFGG
jgi:hypothetical protein